MAVLLDEQVRRNKAATVRLFIVVFLVLVALIFAIGVVLGYPPTFTAPVAVLIGIVYFLIASSSGVSAVLAAARARPANPNVREERLLIYAVEEMAIAAGLPPPKVYVQDDDDINAFAAGRDPKEAVVCATTGALRSLTQEELQGVIGHELSHIKNQDIKVTTYAVVLIGLIAMLAEIAIRGMFFGGGRRGGDRGGGHILVFLLALALIILAPILSRLVYFAISRRREYLADASGAELTRNPEGLASALEKIAGRQPQPNRGDRTVAALYLDNPFRRLKGTSVWSTHPPLEERVRRLRGQGRA
jgi:heat shock protein HtpX